MNKYTIIAWDRSEWYENIPQNPHIYYFLKGNDVVWDDIDDLPSGFLRIPSTALYEFGGTHTEALKALEGAGYTDILLTNNLA
jgi:hypothetical protein